MFSNRNIIYVVTGFLALLLVFCNQTTGPKNKAETNSYLNLHDSANYVGMEACKSCHANVHQTFSETGMGKSFDRASLEKSDANYEKPFQIYDPTSNFYYQPYFKDGKMYVHEYRLANKDTIHSRTEEISYIIGSGQHTNSHITDENGYVYQAPVTYYTQDQKWDMAPGFENENLRFSRALSSECITCHNHLPKMEPGSFNKYLEMPTGIECERCHGPGSIHLKEKLSGNIIDTSKFIDYSIVNPKHLSRELQMDICQRCHLQGVAVLNEGKSFFDFKPGMKLNEVLNVFLPRYTNSHEKFIMASQADRLRLSPCFTETTSLSCITCHNPHQSVRTKKAEQYNQVCSSCHDSSKEKTCSEEGLLRSKAEDNCIKCHMPKSGSIDIPHVNITDHYISKENNSQFQELSQEKRSEIAAFLGLQILTKKQASPLEMAKGYIALFDKYTPAEQMLDSAKYYLGLASGEENEKWKTMIHYHFSRNEQREILQLSQSSKAAEIHDHWTLYRIGEANFQNKNYQRAIKFFSKAAELMPFDLDIQEKKGTTLMLLNRLAEAETVYQYVLKENPKRKITLCNLGYIKVLQNNFAEGLRLYKQAIALDPDYEQALLNLSAVYLYQGNKVEVENILNRVLKINPENEEAQNILKNLS